MLNSRKMRDNLKEHIEKEREEFEVYEFSQEKSWSEISDRLSTDSKPKHVINYWKYAVAACLIVASGWFAYNLGQNEAGVYNELSEVESYYQNEIATKLTLVKTKMDDPLLIADLELMDEAFADLKKDLKDNVDNAEVVEAMMENYRLKLEILEKILEKINKDEKGKDEREIRL